MGRTRNGKFSIRQQYRQVHRGDYYDVILNSEYVGKYQYMLTETNSHQRGEYCTYNSVYIGIHTQVRQMIRTGRFYRIM